MFKFKRVLALAVALATVSVFTAGVGAEEAAGGDLQGYTAYSELSQLSNTYSIPIEELESLDENLNAIIDSGVLADISGEQTVSIPVSDNIILSVTNTVETEAVATLTRAGAVYQTSASSSAELKNIFGITIVTLTSVGVFQRNGTTSTPVDAYGIYSATVWNVTNSSSALGGVGYNSWVRNSFSGQFNVGIDPIAMTIKTFSKAGTVYCDANGVCSASWS